MKSTMIFVLTVILANAAMGQQPVHEVKRGKLANFGLFLEHKWKPIAANVFVLGSSAAASHYGHECRVKFGPAPCDGGYGEFTAREWVRFSMSLTTGIMSWYGYEHHYKEWFAPALGWGGYNIYVVVHQSGIGCPKGEHFLYGTKFTCVSDYPPGWSDSLVPRFTLSSPEKVEVVSTK